MRARSGGGRDGAAGIVQGATLLARFKSAVGTGGVANPLVAAVELAGSIATSILAVVVPVVVLVLVGVLCTAVFLASHRFVFGRRRYEPQKMRTE